MQNKTFLIISREYTTRVKKKSFIIMTILLPVLIAALIFVPVLVMLHSERSQHTRVLVVDDTEIFLNTFQETDNTTYQYRSGNIDQLTKEALDNEEFDCVFHILDNGEGLRSNLYYKKSIPSNLQSSLESQMNETFFDRILQDSLHIELAEFQKLQDLTKVNITAIQIDKDGNQRENDADMNMLIGMACGFFIYFIIIIFASQVLRGVLEEKSNRIVEVLISSVKPMQLLTGKIVGIALVGITQFLIWVVLTTGILFSIQLAAPNLFSSDDSAAVATEMTTGMADSPDLAALADGNIFQVINNYFPVSFAELLLSFFFYFVIGYLIYATLYAATGSVVDSESDSQQYTMPVTLPLILSIIFVPTISSNPNGQLALWLSMIPLTSPISMMVRLPSGVPLWQLLTSMGICLLFLVFCIWFAAKVYRVGILMYGKKNGWKEIFRWLREA
ncbi:MAG: ABC transporter permease [Bacteroidales bacterium]|nr:ABC transporter permease [Bacteroidales bacterium]